MPRSNEARPLKVVLDSASDEATPKDAFRQPEDPDNVVPAEGTWQNIQGAREQYGSLQLKQVQIQNATDMRTSATSAIESWGISPEMAFDIQKARKSGFFDYSDGKVVRDRIEVYRGNKGKKSYHFAVGYINAADGQLAFLLSKTGVGNVQRTVLARLNADRRKAWWRRYWSYVLLIGIPALLLLLAAVFGFITGNFGVFSVVAVIVLVFAVVVGFIAMISY